MNKLLTLELNKKQCTKIIKTLNEYYKNTLELANVDYPKTIKYKTNEYYFYMFYSCLLNYGMRSKIYNQNIINTYSKYPNIFNPKTIITMNELELKEIIIKNIHPRYPNIAVKKWIELSNQLINYQNITLNLKNIKNIAELNKFIFNIKGYGQKTGSLLIRIICDSKICNFEENTNTIPIDRHDIEISYLTDIIKKDKLSIKEIKELSNTYVEVGNELGINPSDIDKYLWELGSTLCNKKKCSECPIKNYCKKGKNCC